MKLNYDCLRQLLIALEKSTFLDEELNYEYGTFYDIVKLMPDFQQNEIAYTTILAEESGLIIANIIDADDGFVDCLYQRLTFEGHQFLDTIRDNNVWNKVKRVISKVSGVSLDILISVAKDILKSTIGKQ